MSISVGDTVRVGTFRPGLPARVGEVLGTLQNRPDWFNVLCEGYISAIHRDELSRET